MVPISNALEHVHQEGILWEISVGQHSTKKSNPCTEKIIKKDNYLIFF